VRVNPFQALGLPARPDLDDEQVRAAWRAIAAASHPDRADGGDPARYAQASAAYAELRTSWGRGEAYADLLAPGSASGEPGTAPLPVIPSEAPPSIRPARRPGVLAQLPARIWHGRRLRLLLRATVAVLVSLAVLALIPGQAAAPAVITGVIIWLVLTGRADLAPPGPRA
jgi:hypothetical protein